MISHSLSGLTYQIVAAINLQSCDIKSQMNQNLEKAAPLEMTDRYNVTDHKYLRTWRWSQNMYLNTRQVR